MLVYRKPLQLRGSVRRALELIVTFSTALFFSYLILQTRW